MPQREELEAVLKGISQEAKRTVYVFVDPKDKEKELRFSAFPPCLPVLSVGTAYKFAVEHVPTGEEGKHYHNLARKSRDGDYVITPVGAPYKTAGEFPVGPPPEGTPAREGYPTRAAAPPQAAKAPLSRDDYWGDKERRDIAKDPVITRLSCISSASMAIGSAVQGGAMRLGEAKDAENELARLIKALALRLEGFANEARKPEGKP